MASSTTPSSPSPWSSRDNFLQKSEKTIIKYLLSITHTHTHTQTHTHSTSDPIHHQSPHSFPLHLQEPVEFGDLTLKVEQVSQGGCTEENQAQSCAVDQH